MDMNKWIKSMLSGEQRKAVPILSFPCVQLLGCTVRELVSDSELQAKGMKAVAEATDSAAAVSMMDLSVEAEAFGSEIRISDNEVPAVLGAIVKTEEQADSLVVPNVGSGRTALYVQAIAKAKTLITDRPILAGVTGPFSLAGRLMDVTDTLIYCYDEPNMVHKVLEKTTQFIIAYTKAFKESGADGVVIAEPLAGLLSADMAEEFSSPYVKKITQALQDDNFIVVYHNCGSSVKKMLPSIIDIGCKAYHFGNAINMEEILPAFPGNVLVMGNIDPVSQFNDGTPESIKNTTSELMNKLCPKYKNFVISSGCDIPPKAKWENIRAFFEAVRDFK